MSTFYTGRNGFHKGAGSLEKAMSKAMDKDVIVINQSKEKLENTVMIRGGVTIQGDLSKQAPIIAAPGRQAMLVIGGQEGGTVTLRHLRIQVDDSSIGFRINSANCLVVLDDVQIYHKKSVKTPYSSVIAGPQAPMSQLIIKNSLIDSIQARINNLQVENSNIGDWFNVDNSEIYVKQAMISGTALQNTLMAGFSNNQEAQIQINNSALGGNVEFTNANVTGDTIQFTQLPIINHNYALPDNLSNRDASTSLLVGPSSKIKFSHVTQAQALDSKSTKLPLPQWRTLGVIGGSLELADAYLSNTGLKNKALSGNIRFENVTDDSQWERAKQWQAGSKMHLANRNSKSQLFDQQSMLNMGNISGQTGSIQQSKQGLEKLDELIGLKPVKVQLRQIIAQAKASAERRKRGLGGTKHSRLHMVFAGNPGTGKTTVARLVGQALYEAGVLESTTFKEVRASDLVSQYVGKTSQKTRAVVRSALDGVLFIDEAYQLAPPSDGSNSFNNDAITELVADMENYADRLVVIMAGYTQDMHDFFNRGNQGLLSRMPYWIDFPDYSPLELKQIERLKLKHAHARIANPRVMVVLDQGIDELLPIVSRSNSTGNGRFVDNYVNRVTEMRDTRLAQGDMSQLSDEELMVIQPEDVIHAVDAMKRQLSDAQA